VTAVQLLRLFDFVYATSIVGWLGAILFFSFGVAPIIFDVLEAEAAGNRLGHAGPPFPRACAASTVPADAGAAQPAVPYRTRHGPQPAEAGGEKSVGCLHQAAG